MIISMRVLRYEMVWSNDAETVADVSSTEGTTPSCRGHKDVVISERDDNGDNGAQLSGASVKNITGRAISVATAVVSL